MEKPALKLLLNLVKDNGESFFLLCHATGADNA